MNDLISRSALLSRIKPPQEDDEQSAVLMSDVRRIIYNFVMAAPAVDAEKIFEAAGLVKEAFEMAKSDLRPVRHGRWSLAEDGDGVVCSCCGKDFCNLVYETDDFKYCPNCGAKMDGADE